MAVQSEPQQYLDFLLSSAVLFISISLQSDIFILPASLFARDEHDIGLAIPCPAKVSPRRTNRKTCFNTKPLSDVLQFPSTESLIEAIDGVRSVSVEYSPGWITTTPKDASKITIELKETDDQ